MASISSFPNLFRPLQVGSKHVLKNRAIMGSMHVGMEDSPVSLNPFSRPPPLVELAAFYRERAKNNCALIVTGTCLSIYLSIYLSTYLLRINSFQNKCKDCIVSYISTFLHI